MSDIDSSYTYPYPYPGQTPCLDLMLDAGCWSSQTPCPSVLPTDAPTDASDVCAFCGCQIHPGLSVDLGPFGGLLGP